MKHQLITALVSIMLISAVFSGIGFAQSETPTETPTTEAGAQADNETANNTTADESAVSAPPGLQISVMMGKMGEDISNSIDRYSLGHQMKNAETQEERKKILNKFLDKEVEESEKAMEEQKEVADENESESSKGYTQAMNMIESRSAAENGAFAKKMAEKYNVSVNQSKVEILSNNARNMSGQEVSKLARSLAGPPEGVGGGSPPWAGGPDKGEDKEKDDENETEVPENLTVEDVTQKIADANAVINNTTAGNNSSVNAETLNKSQELVSDAEETLDKTQAENTSAEEREEFLEDAYELASDSIENIEEAQEEAEEYDDVDKEEEKEDEETEDDDTRGPPAHAGGK